MPRERLLERLDDGLLTPGGQTFSRRLTLIAAPAGFGKTTLASQWVSRHPGHAWLSLDEDDDDLRRFFSYLAGSVARIDGLGASLAGLLQAPQALPARALATALIQDITPVAKPFILVLDDAHLLTRQEILDGLAYLLDHLPPVVHLVMTSRAVPELPLSRLRARAQLLEVGPAELRFTGDEAAAFMNDSMGLALAPDDIATLEDRTEGWAAGLQLAALAIQPVVRTAGLSVRHEQPSELESGIQRFIRSFSGDDRLVSDYLVEEVLGRHPGEVTRFLLSTAITEHISGELANALTGGDDGQSRLEWLEQKNLLIMPLDGRREWFRYHPLLAGYLRQRLAKSEPGRLVELQRRAGRWFADHGSTGQAVGHLLAAGDLDQAATLIEGVAREMAMRGDVAPLVRWLNAFPEEYLLNRPGLVTIEVILETITGTLMERRLITEERLGRSIEMVEQKGPGPEKEMLLAELNAHWAGLAMLNLDFDRSLAISYQAREYATGNDFVLSYIFLVNGTTYRLMGQDDLALVAFSRAVAHSEKIESTMLIVTCLVNMAELYEVTGQLSLAEATCRRALAKARDRQGQPLPSAGQAFLGLAKVNRERNQLDEATANLNEALRLAELTAMSGLETDCRMTQALLERAKGNWAGAYAALERADKLTTLSGDPFTSRRVGAFRSRFNLVEGNTGDPRFWLQVNGLSVADPVDVFLEIEYLTLARILLAEGQFEDALVMLDRWQPSAESLGRRSRLIEYHHLRAQIASYLDGKDKSHAHLKQAMELAEAEGFVRVFADEGQPMANMLSDLLAESGESGDLEMRLTEYARQLLNIIDFETDRSGEVAAVGQPEGATLVEPLKERELQVLRLIAAGLSNREIGAELFLTEGTVKSYTHQLYSKLGVHRRTEAVDKARELHLIP